MRRILLLVMMFMLISQASAYDKTFYEGNKTLAIQQSITGKTLFTIQQVSVAQGTTPDGESYFVEVYNITSYLASDYTFSASDIGFSWKQYKGNKNITGSDFFLFKPSNYSVIVNDYGINSSWKSKEVYNNQTGLNDTVWYWDNQTVIVGNHTEIRDNSTWLKLNNLNGKVIKSGQSYLIKILFTKNFEREFAIKLTPSFIGVSEDRMTWWNASYPIVTTSQVTNPNKTVIYLNLHNGTGTNNQTDVFGSFIFNQTTKTINSTHFVVDNTTEIPFVVNNMSGNDANISVNVSTVNSSNYVGIYWNGQTDYGSSSNFNTTFMGGGDYSGTVIDTTRWIEVDSATYITQNNRLLVSGDNSWGGVGISSLQNFTRPFVYKTYFTTSSTTPASIIGIKDTTAGLSWVNFVYGLQFDSAGVIYPAEDGTTRGNVGTFTANTDYWFMIEVLTTGAKYYNSTNNGTTWNLMYSSVYSTENPLKIGAAQYYIAPITQLDDTIVYNLTSPMPTWAGWGAAEQQQPEAVKRIIVTIIN